MAARSSIVLAIPAAVVTITGRPAKSETLLTDEQKLLKLEDPRLNQRLICRKKAVISTMWIKKWLDQQLNKTALMVKLGISDDMMMTHLHHQLSLCLTIGICSIVRIRR